MHVIGARFGTVTAAMAALLAVRSAVRVAAGDTGVRPLGSTRYEQPAEGFLLAGRFADEDVDTVVRIVEAEGGRIIEHRRELPRAINPAQADGSQAWPASNPPWSPPWTPARRAATAQVARVAHHGSGSRKPVRRPAAPLRVRAARWHRAR